MLYIIYLMGGILIGIMVSSFGWLNYIRNHTYGTLKQAHDEGETYLFLELSTTPDEIKRHERVVFKVSKDDITPHD